jgi:V-type H+-transporting ATPase subunit d
VSEFRYIRANAVGTLAKFMDYMTYGYMIDNVALLITGTLHERDTRELLERCHPLGVFESMPVLCVATNVEELYNTVLVETPLAPYFKGNLSSADLDELNIEIIRNTLYKSYLEDFHQWCTTELEGPSAEIMYEMLSFEADRRAINITLNSFGTELGKKDRQKLYPSFGKLYPEGTYMLGKADDVDDVRAAVEGVGEYKSFFDQGFGMGSSGGALGGNQPKSLEDLFYQRECEMSKLTFTQQFTVAVVYAWVKLKEQVRNPNKTPSAIDLTKQQPGNPKHHVDFRVHSTESEGEDWELHQHILDTAAGKAWVCFVCLESVIGSFFFMVFRLVFSRVSPICLQCSITMYEALRVIMTAGSCSFYPFVLDNFVVPYFSSAGLKTGERRNVHTYIPLGSKEMWL